MDRTTLPDSNKENIPLPEKPKRLFRDPLKLFLSIIGVITLLIGIGLSVSSNATAGSSGDCRAFATGSINDLASLNVPFSCGAVASTTTVPGDDQRATGHTVYFGVCDSGNVPNDDLFTMSYMGSVVSSNRYDKGRELVSIGSAFIAPGAHTALLQSISSNNTPPATYGYGISPIRSEVINFLNSYCGVDILNPGLTTGSSCVRSIPVRTEGVAPSNGKLVMRAQYGSMNRPEGYTIGHWNLTKGQFLNNAPVDVPAPQYARLWWQPEGSSEWYLLPSQYWRNDGTLAGEYGASCASGSLPSYHTAFDKAIPASQVPLLNR